MNPHYPKQTKHGIERIIVYFNESGISIERFGIVRHYEINPFKMIVVIRFCERNSWQSEIWYNDRIVYTAE